MVEWRRLMMSIRQFVFAVAIRALLFAKVSPDRAKKVFGFFLLEISYCSVVLFCEELVKEIS
jgi:hypothetical protein